MQESPEVAQAVWGFGKLALLFPEFLCCILLLKGPRKHSEQKADKGATTCLGYRKHL